MINKCGAEKGLDEGIQWPSGSPSRGLKNNPAAASPTAAATAADISTEALASCVTGPSALILVPPPLAAHPPLYALQPAVL